MSKTDAGNRVYFSPCNTGALSAFHEIFNCQIFVGPNKLSRLNTTKLFLHSLIQCGAREIAIEKQTFSWLKNCEDLPPNIINRLVLINNKDAIECQQRIFSYLKSSLAKNKDLNKEDKFFVSSLSTDLSSLIFCASNKLASCQYWEPSFDTQKIERLFDIETSIPLVTFLNSARCLKYNSTVIKQGIEKRDIFIIEEILKSNFYINLSKQHQRLRKLGVPPEKTTQQINRLALSLKNHYDNKVYLKNALFSAFDFGQSIIPFFGDFAKNVGGIFNKSVKQALKNDSRLIIYQQKILWQNILTSRVADKVMLELKTKYPNIDKSFH